MFVKIPQFFKNKFGRISRFELSITDAENVFKMGNLFKKIGNFYNHWITVSKIGELFQRLGKFLKIREHLKV